MRRPEVGWAAAHDRVGVGVVVLPVGPDVLLAADVPHVELEATVLHRLDVEPLCGRDVRHVLLWSADARGHQQEAGQAGGAS